MINNGTPLIKAHIDQRWINGIILNKQIIYQKTRIKTCMKLAYDSISLLDT